MNDDHLKELLGSQFVAYSPVLARAVRGVKNGLYLTQLMYWGNGRTKMYYSASDTIHISELIPMAFPDWDPRDLLPFPISSRTAGFQVVYEQQDISIVLAIPDGQYRAFVDHGAVYSKTVLPHERFLADHGFSVQGIRHILPIQM